MLSRLSVKKPYTVVVAVVLVLILGVVSFTKMNTDLLPSMNLPYAIVMTTYQGASPETVEMAVTKPIEQSMATVTSIENVSSVSQENVSLVILEFAETANMDSATIEMRENLDLIGSYWDDSVGKPIIMKLNPDMMPVMVAAVECGGMEDTEVTDFVSSHVEPELESIAGVASVTTTGTVTEDVDVLIREDKIADMNQKVRDALLGTFSEKEQELQDAQEELDEGKEELETGKEELETGRQQAAEQIGQGAAQLSQAQTQLIEGRKELEQNQKLLEEKVTELYNGRKQVAAGEEEAREGLKQLQQSKSALEQLPSAIAGMKEKKEELTVQLAQIDEGLVQIQALLQMDPDNAQIKEQEQQLLSSRQLVEKGIQEIDQALEQSENTLKTILEALEAETPEEA